MSYVDRADAGRRIAPAVADAISKRGFQGNPPLVLGVPRGGMVVAVPIARELSGELDLALARKISAPHNRELAIGAVGEGGAPVFDERLIDRLGVDHSYLESATQTARHELERRAVHYRGDRPAPSASGRVVVVVDDGIATGATLRVTLDTICGQEPELLICAVPVGPPESARRIAGVVDELVCPLQPRWFRAVGEWYESFEQTTDAEVVAILDAERKRSGG